MVSGITLRQFLAFSLSALPRLDLSLVCVFQSHVLLALYIVPFLREQRASCLLYWMVSNWQCQLFTFTVIVDSVRFVACSWQFEADLGVVSKVKERRSL